MYSSSKRGRHYAAEAVRMAIEGESPKAFIDAIPDPAIREIARAMAKASFDQIRFYAVRIANQDTPEMRARYAQFRVPEGWRADATEHAEYLINKRGLHEK